MTVYHDPAENRTYLVHGGDWNKALYFFGVYARRAGFYGRVSCRDDRPGTRSARTATPRGNPLLRQSGYTGWRPNGALYACAARLTNGMKLIDNPCEGPDAHHTFGEQSTWIFTASGQPCLMLDHWQPLTLRNSGYSILPIRFEEGRMVIP